MRELLPILVIKTTDNNCKWRLQRGDKDATDEGDERGRSAHLSVDS